jgi:hypothetical protein
MAIAAGFVQLLAFDRALPGCDAGSDGENDRSLTTSDTKTRPLNQAPAVRSSSS